jgi:hypothetical protein
MHANGTLRERGGPGLAWATPVAAQAEVSPHDTADIARPGQMAGKHLTLA